LDDIAMPRVLTTAVRFAGAIGLAASLLVGPRGAAMQAPTASVHEAGSSLTPFYEGWFRNANGTYSLLLGYANSDPKVPFDIPVGPDNSIEPGGPDRGQPTHFNPNRQWAMFAVVVPADFGDRTLAWTVVAGGTKMAVSMALDPRKELAVLADQATGDTAPLMKFDPAGRAFQGPPSEIAASVNAVVREPVPLTAWVVRQAAAAGRRDADPAMLVRWSRFRGPGIVRFSDPTPPVDAGQNGRATTNATFLAAGDYVMRVQTARAAGDGVNGAMCCWTAALVKVAVAESAKPNP
jgi:hypothetical protein